MQTTGKEKVLWSIAILLVLLYALIPVMWITSLSLKPPDQVGDGKFFPKEISLDNYMGLVVAMLLSFGLSFQLPLVVLALVRLGILDLEMLKESRRYVYFSMVIVAAVITPGQDIPSLIGLTVPLCLLFELGLWLAREPKGAGAGTV